VKFHFTKSKPKEQPVSAKNSIGIYQISKSKGARSPQPSQNEAHRFQAALSSVLLLCAVHPFVFIPTWHP